jgi:hypothetical protein
MTRRRMVVAGIVSALLVAAVIVVVAVVGSSDSTTGRSWESPSRVPVPSLSAASPQVVVGDDGGVHVLFSERQEGAWSLRQVSRAPGGDWSSPQTLVAGSAFPIMPAGIAANRDGDLAALWSLSDGRRSVLMASARSPGGEWAPEQALSRVGSSAWGRVVVAPDGVATVIGRGLAGPGLWAVRREPGGRWEPARRISTPGLGVDAPAVAVGVDGRLGVVALAKRPGVVRSLFSVQSSAEGEWGRPVPLAGSEGARGPAAVFAADVTLVAGWSREGGGRVSIESATRPPTGSWSRPRVEDSVPQGSAGPVLFAGVESPKLVWTRWNGAPEDRRAQVRAVDPAVPGPADIIAAPVLPPVGGNPNAGPSATIYGPPPLQLVGGGSEGAVLSWGHPAATGSSVSVTTSSGRTWTDPVELAGGAPFAFPIAAGGGSGHDAVVWSAGPPLSAADRLLVAER